MMRYPLSPTHFIERAAALFGEREVVTAGTAPSDRRNWSRVALDARSVSAALRELGVREGDRVATLAWNGHRHLELYFAVPAMGAVLHTVNVRLAPAQIAEIVRHAGARVLLADPEEARAADRASLEAAGVERFLCLSERDLAPPGWDSFDERVSVASPATWVPVDENSDGALCYTSGTTGEPKGVAYTHRAIALHTLAICLPDGFGISERDVVLPAVPMFHANAWGLPHAAAMTGAGLVLPGVRPDAARLADLLAEEGVTFAAGVPTVWMAVLAELRARPRVLHPELRIHAGGAPSPPALIEAYRRELGVEIVTGWGMTELTPVGMVTHPRASMSGWSDAALLPVRTSQGTPLPFVEARLVAEDGADVPHDGETPGELEVRGPWVTAGYYRRESTDSFHDGWLRTGDVATRDRDGYFRLVDRTKDLIRSGGEWISSVRLEHALMDEPGVEEACVVAVPDARWQERPWAYVVAREGAARDADALLAPLTDLFPRWWLPDRIVFVDEIPRTATGKFDKKVLRDRARASLGAVSGG